MPVIGDTRAERGSAGTESFSSPRGPAGRPTPSCEFAGALAFTLGVPFFPKNQGLAEPPVGRSLPLVPCFGIALRSRPTAPFFFFFLPVSWAPPAFSRCPGPAFAPLLSQPCSCLAALRGRCTQPPCVLQVCSCPAFVGVPKRSPKNSPESSPCQNFFAQQRQIFTDLMTAVELLRRTQISRPNGPEKGPDTDRKWAENRPGPDRKSPERSGRRRGCRTDLPLSASIRPQTQQDGPRQSGRGGAMAVSAT